MCYHHISDGTQTYSFVIDRNGRKQNIILFGVKEEEEITIGMKKATTDVQKCGLLLEYIGCPHVTIADQFRVGKQVNKEKRRPIKITFSDKKTSFDVIGKTAKLKELKDSHQMNVYIKPDKTKAEVAEFQRLVKRKMNCS